MTFTGTAALTRLEINLGLTTDVETITPEWTPAWYCGHAHYTLRWNEHRLDWVLREHGRAIAALAGYPVGAPVRGTAAALAWADGILGPQQWIPRPARSGAHHTHGGGATTCTDRNPQKEN